MEAGLIIYHQAPFQSLEARLVLSTQLYAPSRPNILLQALTWILIEKG